MAAVTAVAVRELSGAPGWSALLEELRVAPGLWVLESALQDGRLGRFSFVGARPYATLRMRGTRLDWEVHRTVRPDLPAARRTRFEDPLTGLRGLLPEAVELESDAAGLPFVGGAVGWLGYELAACIERVAFPGLDDLGLPDASWQLVDRVLAHEHATGRLFACALGFGDAPGPARDRAARGADAFAEDCTRGRVARLGLPAPTEALAPSLHAPGPSAPLSYRDPETGLELGAWFDEATYGKAVELLLERIAAGDVYQANLTHRLEARFEGDPWRLFRRLARHNPAPFAAYLATPEITVVGSSPERFLRLDPDGRVESRPIKGTRPRAAEAARDAALAEALAVSEKDRAENLMIVDLVRNDLGRVYETASIDVPELFAIEPYATVFQMVSTVTGRLRPDRDVVDLLRAAFPPGSMTGAPKIAAMQLLARLEPVRRGVYSGALGYLDARGGADLCVVIRTVLARPGRAWLHVGGGIVADSEPQAEWQESLDKARALLDALAATQAEPRAGR